MIDSREGDRLIAQQVMGWTWNEVSAWSASGTRYARRSVDDWDYIPFYFTDMGAMWSVVNRLRERDWWIELRHVLSHGQPAMQCTFSYIPHMAPERRVIATANDELAAIGIAALRVAGVDEDTIFAAVNAAENLAEED